MHWAQEVQYGPREGRQLLGWGELGSWGQGCCTLGTSTVFSWYPQLIQQSALQMRKPRPSRAQPLSGAPQPVTAGGSATPSTAAPGMGREPGGWVESVMSMDLRSLGAKPLFPPLGAGHWTGETLDSGAQSPEVSSSYPPGGGG